MPAYLQPLKSYTHSAQKIALGLAIFCSVNPSSCRSWKRSCHTHNLHFQSIARCTRVHGGTFFLRAAICVLLVPVLFYSPFLTHILVPCCETALQSNGQRHSLLIGHDQHRILWRKSLAKTNAVQNRFVLHFPRFMILASETFLACLSATLLICSREPFASRTE